MFDSEYLINGIKNSANQLNKTGILLHLELTTASFLNLYLSIKTLLPVFVWTQHIEWQPPSNVKKITLTDNIPQKRTYINTFLLEHSETNNLLLLSNRDYVEINYVRPYYRSEITDYNPLRTFGLYNDKNLRWSQICKLYDQIDFKQYPSLPPGALEKSTDKAYNTNITYQEYEWLMDLEDIRHSPESIFIIKNDRDPTKDPKWFTFTLRQKQIISELHQIEKITKHKVYNHGS